MAELDVKDKKIIHFLSLNARESDTRIAKEVELSRAAVNYRIKRLEKEGIIRKYISWINTFQLGYNNFHIYLKLRNFTLEKQNKIINIIKQNPNIKWLVTIGWPYDLFFVMSAKDLRDLDIKLKELYSNFEEDILGTKIFVVDSIIKDTPPFFPELIKNSKKHDIQPFDKETKLDKTDVEMLNFLSENARLNVVELAELLSKKNQSITPEAVSYRLKRMKRKGILKKYSADLDYRKLNFQWFMVIFKFNKVTEEFDKKIKSELHNRTRIHYIDKTMDHQIRFQILAKNLEEVNEELTFIRNLFEGYIEDYEVLPLFEQYILTTMPKAIYEDLLKESKE
ncbi:HTH-type transcriptional regulator Ptr2 [uncultured archaeon]|nr:HTH-type transcriptional regulator Ptr2 [uncultured archaeon]